MKQPVSLLGLPQPRLEKNQRRQFSGLDRTAYGVCVLDYTATSNHVHLIVRDRGRREIAASMQLIEGCTGQAYNQIPHLRASAFICGFEFFPVWG